MLVPLVALAGVGAVTAALGVAEALAVVRTDRDLRVDGLPRGLDGLRVAHVSDLHLGAVGVNRRAAERAVGLVVDARPDLIAITGDLLSHPRGVPDLLRLVERLDAPLGVYAILGNHDVGEVRDPLSRPSETPDLDAVGVRLLRDETAIVEHAGCRVAISGLEPRRPDGPEPPAPWPRPDADLHLVLSHYPEAFDDAPGDAGDVVLAGHLHGGQICVPWPGGRLRLSQLGHRYAEGEYRRGHAVMHVTRGVGTTFVPFRLLARPEVTVLRLVG